MTVAYLADSGGASYFLGQLIGVLLIPGAGLILLIIGLRKRSTARQQASRGHPPGYSPPLGYPPAYPASGPMGGLSLAPLSSGGQS
jgi:hypothetical protein